MNGVVISSTTKFYKGFDLVEEQDLTKDVQYSYDAYGRKESETVTDLVTGATVIVRFEYDSLHRLVRTINESVGIVETTIYDKADRDIEHQVSGSDGTVLSLLKLNRTM